MKKTIKLAVVAALALGATSAFATNGSTLIGMGAKARGMAGTGIGMSHGAESALVNPALITSVKNTEISFGGTLFMPNVHVGLTGVGEAKSKADMNVIPEVSIASKVTDNFYAGIGIWGTAGMGTDYRDMLTANVGTMQMVTNLQIMQFGVPLAYKMDNFSVAVTPILQYGALDINYDMDANVSSGVNGAGVAQDLAFGYSVGLAYENSGLTVGAVYKSRIDMEYTGQLSGATQAFVDQGIFPLPMSDKLSTPAEIGVGASYAMGESTIAIDYKKIKWSDAEGYKDFKWDDQSVIAVGYEYKTDSFALRLGYNHASNPIKDAGAMTLAQFMAGGMNMTSFGGNAINMFNLLGFPAVVESHYAVGATFNISDVTSVDLAYTYAPETDQTLMTMPSMVSMSDMTTSVRHSQQGVSAQVNFAF
ncbi:outer membrane protein transport protein [Sulfurimonas sp. C5]|uniref:OmpP1/FadL family transporter n=1 Tax=Sulfurimonas sp. C5 TaxID=3036947 RepID=UPI0024543723|nr:outer membrane protein transport protein [Sulfurimonas sp. C5]MDH4945498.1 outer membrane protein transport protein [Sulfurimonas sp. C5]